MWLKKLLIFLLFLGIPVEAALAEDAATRQEVEQLERRIEALEKKQEATESGPSSWAADNIAIGGVISGAYQYEWVSGPSDPPDRGRGALPVQPEVSITPTAADEMFFKFGFAAGNGLNGVTSFNLSSWAADLEDDVKNINGRNRDYLLTAWYKHRFDFSDDHALGLTGGLIDSTDYLDDNAYSNDEFTQFMNAALVGAPNALLPSYDIGAALQWYFKAFGVSAVAMNVGENEDGNNFNFFGTQVMISPDSAIGQGNYRLVYYITSDDFLDPAATSLERRQTLIFSFDQAVGENLGAWLRLALQDDSAAIDYKGLCSGGIYISGRQWGRESDGFGIGYAYLTGAKQTPQSIRSSQVAEAYVNFGLNDYFLMTLDLQYMKDRYRPAAGADDVDGWIAGVRGTVLF